MNDLFKKLNLLVKSGINDVIGDDKSRRAVDPRQLGKDLSGEVDLLRSRVNDAIAHEDSLQKQVEFLAAEIESFDRAVDEAVKTGKEHEAKHLLSQMQFAQQRLTMAQSDLEEHQLVTADLIRRVNLLDTVISEARGQQNASSDAEIVEDTESGSIQASIQERMNVLSDMLKSARDKVSASIPEVPIIGNKESVNTDADTSASDRLSKPVENMDQGNQSSDDVTDSVDSDSNEEDFDARLQRLSKPKKP